MSDTTNIAFISDTSMVEEFVYDTEIVSNILGVQESTVRKYCALMQKHRYEFNKNSAGHRIFFKRDVEILRKIVDLKNLGSLTLNEAVKTILESDIEDITAVEPISPDYTKLLEEFAVFKKEQTDFNQKLIEQLQKQQDYIKNSIEDRDSKLVLALKESMETRRQIAAVAEVIATEKSKKNSWWKFWK